MVGSHSRVRKTSCLVVAEATLHGLDNHTLLKTRLQKTVARDFRCIEGHVKLCFPIRSNTFKIKQRRKLAQGLAIRASHLTPYYDKNEVCTSGPASKTFVCGPGHCRPNSALMGLSASWKEQCVESHSTKETVERTRRGSRRATTALWRSILVARPPATPTRLSSLPEKAATILWSAAPRSIHDAQGLLQKSPPHTKYFKLHPTSFTWVNNSSNSSRGTTGATVILRLKSFAPLRELASQTGASLKTAGASLADVLRGHEPFPGAKSIFLGAFSAATASSCFLCSVDCSEAQPRLVDELKRHERLRRRHET